MKRWAVPIGLIAVIVAAWVLWARGRPIPEPTNVVLITVDTLRVDRVGAYGSTRGLTPRMDKFASESILFEQAYTTVPLTAPSHATILSGKYPIVHGLRNNGSEVLSDEETLLPEILKERGFRTAAIVSALVLASSFGLNQGFDLYYEEDITGSESGHGLWYDQRPANLTVDRALAWLEAESDRPFLLWVHLFDPHDPYAAPSPFKERYQTTPYDGEVAFTDSQIGRLLDGIERLGLYDNSMVVLVADHGEGLGDHGERFHAIFVYDTTMQIPLMVRLPGGQRGGTVVSDLVSTIDITPTILDTMNLPIPDAMDGLSLLEAMRGARVPARSLYLESIYPSSSYGWAPVRSLRGPAWKMIDLPQPELYHLADDPTESTNLNAREPGRMDDMKQELSLVKTGMETIARATQTATIDDETRDRLMSLGYIAGQQSSVRRDNEPDPKDMIFMTTPLKIAGIKVEQGEFADAEEIYTKALEVDPDNKIALAKMARAIAGQKRFDEAAVYYEHALETYPDSEEFYRAYGWMLLNAGRLGPAESVFARGANALPESGHIHFLLGHTMFLGGKWSAAAQELDVATRLTPRASRPYYLLSICRLQEGNRSGALEALEEYLERDQDVETLFNDPYFTLIRDLPEFQNLVRRYL